MGARGRAAAITTAGWATIGLLIGHVAAYDVVYPDAHVHAAALDASGHGWLATVNPALALALVAVVAAAIAGGRSGRPRAARFRTLASIQVAAFVGIELAERLAVGMSPAQVGHELLDHGLWVILVVGILFQLLTAWVGSAFSRDLAHATTLHTRAACHRPRRAPVLPPWLGHVPDRRPHEQRRGRAPPRPIASPRPI
ncbi:MAG: hypothetical protein U0667_13780 [Chloroflexota bacterium]